MAVAKFRDRVIVSFAGDEFSFREKTYLIYGQISINLDTDILQLRDDVWICEEGYAPLPFGKVCELWDDMRPTLLRLVKTKKLFGC